MTSGKSPKNTNGFPFVDLVKIKELQLFFLSQCVLVSSPSSGSISVRRRRAASSRWRPPAWPPLGHPPPGAGQGSPAPGRGGDRLPPPASTANAPRRRDAAHPKAPGSSRKERSRQNPTTLGRAAEGPPKFLSLRERDLTTRPPLPAPSRGGCPPAEPRTAGSESRPWSPAMASPARRGTAGAALPPSGGASPPRPGGRPRGPCPDGRRSWYIRVCGGRRGEGCSLF